MVENVGEIAFLCIWRAKDDTQTRNEFKRTCFVHLEAC